MKLEKLQDLDILLVAGLPGSGKSHFAKSFFGSSDRKRINRKEIRKLLYEMTHFGEKWSEDKFNEHDEFLVKHVERKILEHLLQNRHRVLVDNTSVSLDSHKNYTRIARRMKKSIGIIFLDTDLSVCLQRNRDRDDGVPEMVISTLAAGINRPEREEGFREILLIDDY